MSGGIREFPHDTITGVALLTSDGRMVSLPKPHRHHHLFAVCALLGIDPDHAGHESGFTTADGRFVARGEALMMVRSCGQKMRNPDAHTQLYSEDVW
jgi:hypothetical protein